MSNINEKKLKRGISKCKVCTSTKIVITPNT